MALSALDDPNTAPTAKTLAKALGGAASVWVSVKDGLCLEFAPLEEEWAFTGHFLASFVLGEKAYATARSADLPEPILKWVADAPKYAEGRGVRIQVRTPTEANDIRNLVAIKLAN